MNKIKNKQHRFLSYKFNANGKKVAHILCMKKGGNFYSSVWFNGKLQQGTCPCCKLKVGEI